jgi:hypothetical protein
MADEKRLNKLGPKIVQVMTDSVGLLSGVLYSNGRVFLYTYTKLPDGKNPGEGFWAEMAYPELK